MIAEVADVESRFFRPLDPEERPLVESRLKDAELKIRLRIPSLDERMRAEPYLRDVVKRVCADAVIRLVRNPEGYISETDGNYVYQLSHASADNRLLILKEEWRDLGVGTGFSVKQFLPEMPWEAR